MMKDFVLFVFNLFQVKFEICRKLVILEEGKGFNAGEKLLHLLRRNNEVCEIFPSKRKQLKLP